MLIKTAPSIHEKLSILSQDSQYDLACACGSKKDDRRHRSNDDRWIYPVTLPDGGTNYLFKTLLSNVCVNDCTYCPLRADTDPRRCTVESEEIVNAFLGYWRAKRVHGLFLSSGVMGTPDNTMERINRVARILRKREGFRGYIHLKIIPGASESAIEETLSLASAVSLNIEAPGSHNFQKLSGKKNYEKDVISPLKFISRLTAKGERYQKVKQTTQFVVGASSETDRELVDYTGGLYSRLKLDRVYFSAYQRGLGKTELPGEHSTVTNDELLTREHRLYQVDFLLRKYQFQANEIPLEPSGFLSLSADPKEIWAKLHPEFFPVHVNRAEKWQLLRVPGLGPLTVNRLLKYRKAGGVLKRLDQLGQGRLDKRLAKAVNYIRFS